MIRLAGLNNLVWTSPDFLHTVKTGFSFSQYVLNHGLGEVPDLIRYYSVSADGAPNVERPDFFSDGTHFWGSAGVSRNLIVPLFLLYFFG